jgi:multidrug efflux pump subunit AcrA (membrane-fusion protein)
MDGLLNALVGFAQQMLAERGAFYPCAAGVTASGQLQMVTADLAADQPPPDEVLQALVDRLQQDVAAGEIQAAATRIDVSLAPRSGEPAGDAIRVDIEHADAEPVRLFLPYVIGAPGRVSYGELIAETGPRFLFPEQGHSRGTATDAPSQWGE